MTKLGCSPLQQPTAVDLGRFGFSSSPSIAEGIDGSVVSSSPPIAKENEAPLLSKVLRNMAAMNGSMDGQAMNGKWKDLFSSNRSVVSETKLVRTIDKHLGDVPSRPKANEEASRPNASDLPPRPNSTEMSSRPNDVQGSLNESIDEQRFDPMQMESNVSDWTVVKKRNGKPRVANDSF
ncbi:hypothetical protein OIU84_017498 [Salix udensis]|uniref:Uncharacterized protein n=1 Tax=Salix udensis TaxID=889485 RepID=A0AAD6L257_9ROSI|nr:hypothetical protein OIU84_017498 [Salix udensis]